jgi:hypothetical protein
MSQKTHNVGEGIIPSTTNTTPETQRIRFYVHKNHIRTVEFNDNGSSIEIYHAYPLLTDWVGREAPDEVNPRSHDEDCLRSNVAGDIEQTVTEWPEDFLLANRGATLLVESLKYEPNSGFAEVVISDPENQGLADGATTDAVIAKIQAQNSGGRPFRSLKKEEMPSFLKEARLHLEIIVGLNDRERIKRLVKGRNTSIQVKSWSMADFDHKFDWIIDILDRESGPFQNRIGYEENAGKEITILDVLSLLTLFHWEYDGKGGVATERRKAPTIAYSSKGRMDARLKDENLLPGYKALAPIIEDILRLHDYIYANFETAYETTFGPKSKLGRRQGVESREAKKKPAITLQLTGSKSNYVIPSGLIFPLLASFRALVEYDDKKKARWKVNPTEFFDRYGSDLIGCLFEQVELLGNNPNTAGKKKAVYIAIHNEARLLADSLENGTQN